VRPPRFLEHPEALGCATARWLRCPIARASDHGRLPFWFRGAYDDLTYRSTAVLLLRRNEAAALGSERRTTSVSSSSAHAWAFNGLLANDHDNAIARALSRVQEFAEHGAVHH
jgi:CRISPR/Cas system CMR-associated protein Cmr1 (group 7 of RAMP superfamily)